MGYALLPNAVAGVHTTPVAHLHLLETYNAAKLRLGTGGHHTVRAPRLPPWVRVRARSRVRVRATLPPCAAGRGLGPGLGLELGPPCRLAQPAKREGQGWGYGRYGRYGRYGHLASLSSL